MLILHVAAFLALFVLVFGDTVQDDWIFPKAPDKTSILTNGSSYSIAWTSNLKSWFSSYCQKCDTSNVDLWIAGGSTWKHRITTGIDVASSFAYEWTVAIPSSELADTNIWVFRFIPSGGEIDDGDGEISSSLFIIADATTSSISTTSSTTTSMSSGIALSTTHSDPTADTTSVSGTSSSSSSLAPTDPPSPGLSVGAKAGVGVGAGLGGIILVVFGWFLGRRLKWVSPAVHEATDNKHDPASGAGPGGWNHGNTPVTELEFAPTSGGYNQIYDPSRERPSELDTPHRASELPADVIH
ncbi:hypothetical protein F4779DRAFT_295702 [Xylariaceae sp. FL0662B]|nr:hypothetical protein F4779DRAFT_295702 [Xylariaceae sp. FL0662B]